MKVNEFRKWLKEQGVIFIEGKKHTKLTLGDKISYMPRHPAKELKKGTVEGIKKQLGLK